MTISTPYYRFYKSRLRAAVASVRLALNRYWPNSKLAVSFKTNSHSSVNQVLAGEDVWAEVVSEHEYFAALRAGYEFGSFICNGTSKSDVYISEALKARAVLHLDSIDEVESFVRLSNGLACSFGIRINATESDFDADPLSGPLGSRFGLSVRDGDLERLRMILSEHPELRLTSLHLHCNTRTRGLKGYLWLVKFFARLVREYRLLDVTTFDIGGSFGHDFDHPQDGEGHWPSWNEYLGGISTALLAEGFSQKNLRLLIEPGSALLSDCFDYVTTVVGERIFNGKRVLQIDGSRSHVDPFYTRKSFGGSIVVERNSPMNENPAEYAGGGTCLEKDRIPLDVDVGTAVKGDRLRFMRAGAYTYGLTPIDFILDVPEVLVCE